MNVPKPSFCFQFYESYETKLKDKNVEASQDKQNAWGITDFLIRCFLVPDAKDFSIVHPRFVALPVPLDQRRTLADWHIAKEVSKDIVLAMFKFLKNILFYRKPVTLACHSASQRRML